MKERQWFDLASHLQLPVQECKTRISHREFQAWNLYLAEAWNSPNKTEYYLMQIALEVRRSNSRRPNKHKLEHMKLSFDTGQPKPKKKVDRNKAVVQAKSVWAARFPGIIRRSKSE